VGHEATAREFNSCFFKSAIELEGDVYEVVLRKKRISADLANQLGFQILIHAKERMLQYYYDFLLKFVDPSDLEPLEMDTLVALFCFASKKKVYLYIG